MRTIKFRGFNIRDNKWYYGNFSQLSNGCYLNGIDVNPSTVGQFTGLHDNRKKEIYEGDILHFAKYGNDYLAAVKWNREIGAWCLQLNHEPRLGCKPLGDWLLYDSLEIVGNIHDNPEMLKGGEK